MSMHSEHPLRLKIDEILDDDTPVSEVLDALAAEVAYRARRADTQADRDGLQRARKMILKASLVTKEVGF